MSRELTTIYRSQSHNSSKYLSIRNTDAFTAIRITAGVSCSSGSSESSELEESSTPPFHSLPLPPPLLLPPPPPPPSWGVYLEQQLLDFHVGDRV